MKKGTVCKEFILAQLLMELSGSRWKGKGFSDIAAKNTMSEIVKQLQFSLSHSKAIALLSGSVALLEANAELAELFDRACFGHRITSSEKDNQWFQLSSEETFYMHHDLQSIVVNYNAIPLSGLELWNHMKHKKATFPELYISYAHLRGKNWVVRAGVQYGVDFVAYRHHPALVHSDYAVVVLREGNDIMLQNGRLRSFTDLHCCLRVSGSVAKKLLVLFIDMSGCEATFPSCLQKVNIEERIITRWIAEHCREEYCLEKDCRNDLNE